MDELLNRLGAGLNHRICWFRIKAEGPTRHDDDTFYVLRVPETESAETTSREGVNRLVLEAMNLQASAAREFDFAAPRFA